MRDILHEYVDDGELPSENWARVPAEPGEVRAQRPSLGVPAGLRPQAPGRGTASVSASSTSTGPPHALGPIPQGWQRDPDPAGRSEPAAADAEGVRTSAGFRPPARTTSRSCAPTRRRTASSAMRSLCPSSRNWRPSSCRMWPGPSLSGRRVGPPRSLAGGRAPGDGVTDRPPASSDAVRRRFEQQRRTGTDPEMVLRRGLHARGLRYRVDRALLPDRRRKVDIAFGPARVAVFVDGCFWHSCPEHGNVPKSNREWWQAKLERNVARDRDTDEQLRSAGWHVVRIWEHDLRQDPEGVIAMVETTVRSRTEHRST